MRRTIWFSLICLIGLVGLISVRSLGILGSKNPVKISDDYESDHELPLAIKTDKLPDNEVPVQSDKVAVQTVKIVPEPPVSEVAPEVSKERGSSAYARLRTHRHRGGHRHMRSRSRR